MRKNFVVTIVTLVGAITSFAIGQDEIRIVDLEEDKTAIPFELIEVDKEAGQYLGHPTTCLLEDGKSMLCVYPRGHGRGAIIYKRSNDGGRTWSNRLPTPKSWESSKETPTLHRVVDANGTKRIIMFSGLYPIRMAVSENDGESWSELKPIGNFGGIVAMSTVFENKNAAGHYTAMFHDDGRFLRKDSKRKKPVEFALLKTHSTDGGLRWTEPELVLKSSEMHLCEPGVVRSPNQKQLAVLLRENSRRHASQVIFSDDEGATWSKPKPVSKWLWGDRHVAQYLKDGRLFISFRCNWPKSERHPFQGDWVAWVGRYQDLTSDSTSNGELFIRLKDNHKAADCAYPGVEVLPDGTVVTTTYGHWESDQSPFIISLRLRL